MEAIMKNIIAKIGIVSLFVVGFATISAHAQSSAQYRAEIPFDFSARGANLKAGTYSVGLIGSGSTSGVLAIRGVDHRAFMILANTAWTNISRDSTAKLVFVKTGDQYALAEVVTPDYGAKMKRTITDVKELTSVRRKSDTVVVGLQAKNPF
jgi:hypothetical protein